MSLNRFLLTLLLAPLAIAQTQPKPQLKPANLRSILLEQLRSTHNKAEWFVPVNTAVAGLTPEQARWIPHPRLPKIPHRPTTPSACSPTTSSSGTRMCSPT